jgi:phosphocarrier protein
MSGPSSDGQGDAGTSGAVTRVMKICNEKGLHARASAKFVGVVEKFKDVAAITVKRGEETVSGDSIMGLMMLGAGIGSSITVSATGAQANEAIAALDALVSGKFGEEE